MIHCLMGEIRHKGMSKGINVIADMRGYDIGLIKCGEPSFPYM